MLGRDLLWRCALRLFFSTLFPPLSISSFFQIPRIYQAYPKDQSYTYLVVRLVSFTPNSANTNSSPSPLPVSAYSFLATSLPLTF